MRTFRNVVLGTLAAAIAIGVLGSLASARRLEFSSQSFRVAFPIAGEPTQPEFVSCPFTLEGSFHSRTLSKVSSGLIGYITRAVVAEESCRNGRGRFLAERLPWHVRYESFAGTLPNITSVNGQIIGLADQLTFERLGNITCLYLTSAAEPARFILSLEARGTVSQFRLDERASIRSQTGGLCFPTVLSGATELFTVLGATTRITVRLVA